MATASSGAFETSVYDAAGSVYPNRIRVEWSSSQSVANNTSTIYWTVKSAGGSRGYVMAGPVTVNIAGTTVYSRADRFEMWVGATLGSGSFTLTHNSYGNAVLTAWAEAAVYTYAVSSTRYGYSVDLPQIPRASSISVSGSTMGSPLTISISKAVSSFTHTLTWQFGNRTGTLATQTSSSSISWTPPLDLASQIPSATSGYGTIWCTTFSGGTNVGQKSINFTLNIPSNIAPVINSFNPSIASTKPQNCGLYVKNNSTVRWTASVSGVYGSTIKKCVISGPNLSYETAASTNTYSATSSILTTCGNKAYTITITDTRGRTASKTQYINVEDYNPPVITSCNSFRSNSDGTINNAGVYVTHKINISFYTLKNTNAVKIVIYNKKSLDSTFSSHNVTIRNDTSNKTEYTFTDKTEFAVDTAYDFKIVISDAVGGAHEVISHVGTKNLPINIASDNNSVAVGGYAQKVSNNTGRFDCFWNAHFVSSPIIDSDRNLKNNIQDVNIDIIDSLHPVQYRLTNDNSDIIHYGFVAQDVEQALIKAGVNNQKTGIVYYDEDDTTKERSNYALAYDEIIPLLVKKCQELQREVDELKKNQ